MKLHSFVRFAALAVVTLALGFGAADIAQAKKVGVGGGDGLGAPNMLAAGTTTTSRVVDGSVGATLRCGKWTLEMPAGAFTGSATISMTSVDGVEPTIDLQISDESKNAFRTPVWLSYKYNNGNDAADKAIFWWDPFNRRWVPVPSLIVDLMGGELKVPLWHFSTYKSGKAGW